MVQPGFQIVGWAPWGGYGGDSPEVSGYDIIGEGKQAPASFAVARPMLASMLQGQGGMMQPIVAPIPQAPQGYAPQGYAPQWMPQSLPPRPAVQVAASPSELRRQVLPVGQTTLAAGASIILSAIPQRPFRCERLVITTNGAPGDVLVTDVRVGATPQFVASGSVASDMFQATAVGASLRGDTAQPGITVSVSVTNTSAAPLSINAAIVGEALE